MPLESAFSDFSPSSVASASLAQVHQARLPNGRRVAVKVQYPEIRELVASDLANLGALFRAVRLFERNFDLVPLIDELREHLPRELDFFNEALNSERIAKFFEKRDDLYVPEVHWELTTTRVLVTDFVDGIKISDLPRLEAAHIDRKVVMRSLLEAYCEQILVHGFFHADPHPGNLLVLPPSSDDEVPRIAFLDFGLAKQLPASFRESAVQFAAALLQGKADAMGDALVELGFETRGDSREALHAVAAILLDVAKRLRDQTYLDPAVVRDAGAELPRIIRENPIVRIPGHLVLLGRVFGLLSGLGHTLGVKLDMLRTILPYATGVSPGTELRREGS
jgi:predicted unusual protein kinase regulating ubiquinone biosynthesis (AarF/ABC1/UbiB family)